MSFLVSLPVEQIERLVGDVLACIVVALERLEDGDTLGAEGVLRGLEETLAGALARLGDEGRWAA